MQNVPRSRAAFGQVDQNSARASRYLAAAFASQPVASGSFNAGVAPMATMPAKTSPDRITTQVVVFIATSLPAAIIERTGAMLLAAQRDHRLDCHRPARRHPCRGERHDDEQHRRGP